MSVKKTLDELSESLGATKANEIRLREQLSGYDDSTLYTILWAARDLINSRMREKGKLSE